MEIAMIKAVQLLPHITPIEAVLLADGSKGATMKSLCLHLDIATHGQTKRIKQDQTLAPALVLVSMRTAAGSRLLDVLSSYAIPRWLAGLNITRLSPEKQERAALIRDRAIEAIDAAFSGVTTAQEQVLLAQSSEGTLAVPDAFSTIHEGMLTIIAGMGQLQAGIAALQQTQTTILARLAALEGMPRQYSGSGLPPEKVAHLIVLARALRAKKGIPLEETLASLAAQFCAAHFSDIPAALWPDLLTVLEADLR
jgi:hypothetical protein